MSGDDGTVNIVVAWPRKAIIDGWLISQVIAVDPNGVRHVVEVVDTYRPFNIKKRKS